jgi:EAL domain-containing protein (putative c-di-GMP-specific phosphodiesterase class I)
LQHKDFVNFASELLDQNNLSGENLDIEIVERPLFDNLNAVIDVMNKLRRLGISFSIDDFGTGFSNFSYF